MRVLFVTYPRIGLGRGGLEIQIEKTAEELERNGINVVRYDPWKNQLPEVDVCHIFSADGTLVYHANRAAEIGKPIVMSPVLNCFRTAQWQMYIKTQLSRFAPGMYTDLKRANQMFKLANKVISLNHAEQKLIQSIFQVKPERCVVIPNGINNDFTSGDPLLFETMFGVKDFVLEVASIEPRKNQLNLIKAMKYIDAPLILIGQAAHDSGEYFKECQRIAGENVIFAGHIDNKDPLLASAFAAAKVFCLPSFSEVMPLALYEAAVAGCGLVVSKHVPIDGNISSKVLTVDPDCPEKIASAIQNQLDKPRTDEIQMAVLAMMSWSDIASEIRKIYEEIASVAMV